jgi:dTDP-4-dehydrorhamnose 3,5-epimerase
MKANITPIEGVMELVRNPISDSRGRFQRIYCNDLLLDFLNGKNIKQINHSVTSEVGAIRGMHMQLGAAAEYKIISCVSGEVFDVALDLRRNSPTFLKWHSIFLSPCKYNSLLIPPGVAHGFQCLKDNSELLYLHTENYSPNDEIGVSIKDPRLNIKWPLLSTQISDRDLSFKNLSNDFSGYNL